MKLSSLATISADKLFYVQLFGWVSILPFYASAPWQWVLASIIGYVLYAGVGVAMTFHRQLSHRTYVFHPWVLRALMYLACLANVGSPITWVSVHRAHHRWCDTERDPHSPQHKSFGFMIFGSMYAHVYPKLAVDLLRDPYARFLHQYYFYLQIPVILCWYLLGGWVAVFAMHVIPGALTWLAGSFVNWFNHSYGYQVARTNDTSTNHWLTGYLVMGEGWHNAHHADARRASNQTRWYELDLLHWVARLLGRSRS